MASKQVREYWVKYRRVEENPDRAGTETTIDSKKLTGKNETAARRSLESWLKREQDIMGFTRITVLELLEIRKMTRKLSLAGAARDPHKVNEVRDFVIKFEKMTESVAILLPKWLPQEIRLGRIVRGSANWQFSNWKSNLKNPEDYQNIELVEL
ncbi:MAG: hypothetical protein Q7S73_00075 [bacterium]|nr:hypothetical protein [bacterium]